jgi:hypothetical protein
MMYGQICKQAFGRGLVLDTNYFHTTKIHPNEKHDFLQI